MTVSEIALKYIPPVQCIAHSKKICNKNAKHKSGMLKNINTKQTQEFYSKDAKPNSKIHEQIQLKFFIRRYSFELAIINLSFWLFSYYRKVCRGAQRSWLFGRCRLRRQDRKSVV